MTQEKSDHKDDVSTGQREQRCPPSHVKAHDEYWEWFTHTQLGPPSDAGSDDEYCAPDNDSWELVSDESWELM